MHIPSYSQLTELLYPETSKKESFWEERDQIKEEVAHAMTLVLIQKESNVQFLLYTITGKNSRLWQREQELVEINPSRDESQAVGIRKSELQKEPKITTFVWSKGFKLQMRTFCIPLNC